MDSHDTIVAISSAGGRGARAIIRVSGREALSVVKAMLADELPAAGAAYVRLSLGVGTWIYRFVGPRSYTGEDLIELHLPGGAVLSKMVLERAVSHGVRLAEPGEFTARAFFNGRMDLAQAEGVAATIAAQSERELLAAQRLLAGELATRLTPLMDGIAQTLALVEVGIDFSDEDVTFLSADEVRSRCGAAILQLDQLLAESTRFERLSREPRVVLVGRPNAGKSTLLNTLARQERAVVSNIAGTTRDAIWAEVRLKRGVIQMVDVAGLEEEEDGGGAADPITMQMREQAMRETAQADFVLLVREVTDRRVALKLERPADLVVHTKADLRAGGSGADVEVSAKTGVGIEWLLDSLDEMVFGVTSNSDPLALNARHVALVEEARRSLERAVGAVDSGAEVVALELRETLESLGAILGRISPDDLLGKIFSKFCIGK